MKILYLVSTLARTGPTNQLYNIVNNLDQEKFNPIIVTLSPEPSNSMKEQFKKIGVPIETLNLSRLKGLYLNKRNIREVINYHNPEIIHTQGIRADEIAVKYLTDFKVVSSIRNYPFEDYPKKFGKIIGSLMAYKHLRIIQKAYKPVVCSNTLKETFIERSRIDLSVIQNGVDTEKFYPINDSKKKILREQLGIPLDKNILISVGSLINRKSPEVVIKGFLNSNLSKNYVLLLGGSGPLLEKCKELVRTNSNVILLDSIDNVNEYLQISDYFISASQSEGLPNTVLEALAVGLPVVLSDIKPHLEILDFDSNAGFLFRKNDINKLIEELNNLLNERDYISKSLSAKNIISEHLSAESMSRKYQRLYDDL